MPELFVDEPTAVEVAARIRAREVSPLEVLAHYRARIAARNPEVNAIVWLDDDDAHRRAEALGRGARVDGAPTLLGVPIPIKDLTPVAGWPTTYGSLAVGDAPSTESALAVEALERAGCVLVGRTNTPEFGVSFQTENERYGITRNPWNLAHSPGGSSGGAAAAVAAGMVPIAQGSDGAGSLRVPASACGLVGLKVARGRIPRRALTWEGASVDGVVARDVTDAAVALDAMAGPDWTQWYNAPPPARPFAAEVGADPGRLRIGVLTKAPLGYPIDSACREACARAASIAEELGHHVVEVELPALDRLVALLGEVLAVPGAGQECDWDRASPYVRAQWQRASERRTTTHLAGVFEAQQRTRSFLGEWTARMDLLLTPTMPCLPPPAGAWLEASRASELPFPPEGVFTAAFNVTGQPAISLPLALGPGALPIGVQFVGSPCGESQLIQVASQFEEASGWGARLPTR